MQIFIKTLANKSIAFEAENDTTVSDIKNFISMEENILYINQHILIAGKKLADNDTIETLGLEENATLDLTVSLQGGAASTMDPAIVELSKKYNHDKKICRKCYATLPPRATKCRKRSCGHWPDIRPRKTIKQK